MALDDALIHGDMQVLVNTYLYGQSTTPTNLADDALIRSSSATSTITLDTDKITEA